MNKDRTVLAFRAGDKVKVNGKIGHVRGCSDNTYVIYLPTYRTNLYIPIEKAGLITLIEE